MVHYYTSAIPIKGNNVLVGKIINIQLTRKCENQDPQNTGITELKETDIQFFCFFFLIT